MLFGLVCGVPVVSEYSYEPRNTYVYCALAVACVTRANIFIRPTQRVRRRPSLVMPRAYLWHALSKQ